MTPKTAGVAALPSSGPSAPRSILVGDVGGTNARFALYRYPVGDPGRGEIVERGTRDVREHEDFEGALAAYLAEKRLDPSRLDGACLAVASVVVGDAVAFTNSPWRFSVPEVAGRFGFRRLQVINDFAALGSSVVDLPGGATVTLQRGDGAREGTELVLGPGTGLGVAVRHCESGIVIPSEGGHMSFAPTDRDERELLDFIAQEVPRVSYERILSGAGLARLHAFHRLHRGGAKRDGAEEADAAEVVRRSRQGDPSAAWAVDRFLRILGHFAGDAVLMSGGFRGVHLAGGMLPRMVDELRSGGFLERFRDKGRFSALMAKTPVRLIIDDTAPLRGAALRLLAGGRPTG